MGVDLFFVLSGFLITGILADAKFKKNYFRSFYGRRVLRIFPLYYAVLVIVLLMFPLLGANTGVEHSSHIFFLTYTSNFYFAYTGWDANYLSHLWTLAIEEQFYLVWPLVVFFATSLERLRTGLLWAFISVTILRLILYFSGVGYTSLYLGTETHCDGLIIGGYLALSVRSLAQGALKGLRPNKLVAGILLIIGIFVLDEAAFFPAWDTHPVVPFLRNMIMLPLWAILFVWLIYAATLPSLINRIFSHNAMRWFGKYSYALYVLHLPIAFLVLHSQIYWLSTQPRIAELELFILYFGGSILSPFLSWHLYEKHFLKLKRFF